MSAARIARTAIALAVVGGAIAGGALGISGTDTITTVAGSSQGFSGDVTGGCQILNDHHRLSHRVDDIAQGASMNVDERCVAD